MASDDNQTARYEMIRQLVEQYRHAQPPDQAALREVIAKVYAQALRDTENISDIALKAEFGELQRIASSGDFSNNAFAVTEALVEPIISPIQKMSNALTKRPANPAADLAMTMTAPVVNLMMNPDNNIEFVQEIAAIAGGMVKNAYEFGARELGFPTDNERCRLAEVYDLPYQSRLKALHGETLNDTATMVSIGSAPGLFAKELNVAESLNAAKGAISSFSQLPAPLGHQMPALISGPAETASSMHPAVLMSSAAALPSKTRHRFLPAPLTANQNLVMHLPAAAAGKLEEIKLEPIFVQLDNGNVHKIPVTLHIHTQHRLDSATGQARDWTRLGNALIPMLTEKTRPENVAHKLQAIRNIDIYFNGGRMLTENYRVANTQTGDERISVVVHGHNPTYKNFDNKPIVAAVYPNANVRRPGDKFFRPENPDQALAVTFNSKYNLPNGLAVLQQESERLTAMRDNLQQNLKSTADKERLQYLTTQADIQQQIIDRIKESTHGYPDGARKVVVKPVEKNLPEQRIVTAGNVAADTQMPNPGNLSKSLLAVGADIKTVELGRHGNVPVTVTYHAEMDRSDYLKVAVTANGLDLVDPRTRINMLPKQELMQEIVSLVHLHGGSGHGSDRSMSPAAQDSITAIHLIDLGTRVAKDIDHVGENRYGITVTDNRVLVIAQMKGYDGQPITPVTFMGNLHTNDSYIYNKLAESDKLDPQTTPFFLTGGRHSVARIQASLADELVTLANNVKFYSGGDIPHARHEADFKPPAPNRAQQALNVRRYNEIAVTLDQFLMLANQHRSQVSENIAAMHDNKAGQGIDR